MNTTTARFESTCLRSFSHNDFDPARIASGRSWTRCPIRGCTEPLVTVKSGVKRISEMKACAKHGLRLHSGTFVYWNGPSLESKARLRNIAFRADLAKALVEGKTAKVESGRLGYEMSEDALSWNVFVPLMERGRLREVTKYLCGVSPREEPKLFLWGLPVTEQIGDREIFPALKATRSLLERGITNYVTEPDVMLVVPGELLVCVEAKFSSGNPVAANLPTKTTEKPKDIQGLIGRYLQPAASAALAAIDKSRICDPLHSQLFRNVVFAAEMSQRAGIKDWRVVNLIAKSQWSLAKPRKGYSFDDPTGSVCGYLLTKHRERFSFRTWEGLHSSVIRNSSSLADVGRYLRSKSAHFRPAFDLS